MKEAKFTPGPWQAYIYEKPLGSSELGIYTNYSDDGYGDSIKCIPGDDESEANARLISAAPELLEALETVLTDMLELHHGEIDADHYGDDGCEYCEHIADACAAIAKVMRED